MVEGRDLGYREDAIRVAREILEERGVAFVAVPLEQLDLAVTEFYAEADEAAYLRQRKKLGRNLLIVGLAAFVLPFFGLQLSFLSGLGAGAALLGAACVAAGAYLLSQAERAEEESASTVPNAELPEP